MKPGHDGSVALIDTDTQDLVCSFEAKKDSFPRFEVFNPQLFLDTGTLCQKFPDVFAISGWSKGGLADNTSIGSGYFSTDPHNSIFNKIKIFGKDCF